MAKLFVLKYSHLTYEGLILPKYKYCFYLQKRFGFLLFLSSKYYRMLEHIQSCYIYLYSGARIENELRSQGPFTFFSIGDNGLSSKHAGTVSLVASAHCQYVIQSY